MFFVSGLLYVYSKSSSPSWERGFLVYILGDDSQKTHFREGPPQFSHIKYIYIFITSIFEDALR